MKINLFINDMCIYILMISIKMKQQSIFLITTEKLDFRKKLDILGLGKNVISLYRFEICMKFSNGSENEFL